MSDRATALNFWAMRRRQVCWAHLIRKFVAFVSHCEDDRSYVRPAGRSEEVALLAVFKPCSAAGGGNRPVSDIVEGGLGAGLGAHAVWVARDLELRLFIPLTHA